jgi:hypothetical protein
MRKITLFLPFAARAIPACGHSVLDAAGNGKPTGANA